MKLTELDYEYPEELIALSPIDRSRVLYSTEGQVKPVELSLESLIAKFHPGDLLVLNDSKVIKKRLFARSSIGNKDLEVLFVEALGEGRWQVLFPSSRLKKGELLFFPEGVEANLIEGGRPQILQLNRELDLKYFSDHGELPIPPYIQKARGSRHQQEQDDYWYQSIWAEKPGSAAAPTASLHFRSQHLEELKKRGVEIAYLTLHVGLGTFLPVEVEDLKEHKMHGEWIEISSESLQKIKDCKAQGNSVWALGTTVCRSLESMAKGLLNENSSGGLEGSSHLFIYPGYEFQVVDILMTNFHQPRTTLLALVQAFAGRERAQRAYQWAIEEKFRLFSYGDLSVWNKK